MAGRRRRIASALLAAGCASLRAPAALACSVCFSQANESVLQTYYFTTVFMMLLPVAIVLSIGAWLYHCRRGAGEEAPP